MSARPRRKSAQPERQIAEAVCRWISLAMPSAVYWSSPNEVPFRPDSPLAGRAMMAARKRSGMRAGSPDITVCIPSRTVFLEIKSPKGRLSEAQEAMHARLLHIGHPVYVVRSVDDAIEVFRRYGAIR